MKKLLTILALALALCLLCSAALAAEIELTGTEYQNATQAVKTAGFPATLNVDYTVGGVKKSVSFTRQNDPATVDCGKTAEITYTGTNPFDTTATLVFHVSYTQFHKGTQTMYKQLFATCTDASTEYMVCNTCGEKYELHATAATGHSWAQTAPAYDQKITTAPTCYSTGIWERECNHINPNTGAKCGAIQSGHEQIVDKVAHEFINIATVEPNCKKEGTFYVGCKYCRKSWAEINKTGATYFWQGDMSDWDEKPATVDPNGHDWDGWIGASEATCTAAGTRVRVCKICGEEDKKVDPNKPMKTASYVMTSKYVINCKKVELTFTCQNCKNNANHPAIKVTTEDKATPVMATVTVKDDKDGKVYTTEEKWALVGMDPNVLCEVAAHEYVLTDEYKIGTVKPTCTEKGFTAYKCKFDTTKYTYNASTNTITPAEVHPWKHVDEVAAKGHDYEAKADGGWILKYKPGDGDNEYYVYYRTCGVCGNTENRASKNITPELCEGHKWIIDEENTKAATCTEAGKTAYICEYCLLSKGAAEEVPALGHDWDVTVKKAATCKEEGIVNRICKRCNLAETNVKVEKLAHVPGEPEVTPATTEKEGSKVVKCTLCGEVLSTEVLPKELGETEFTAEVKFGEMTLTGKADQKEGTKEAKAVYARVTYFMADGTYVVVSVPVEADGTFESMNSGNVIHVSVQIVDSAKVRPGEFNRFGGAEFDVK